MPWVKIPQEHHPILLAALPKDPRVSSIKMFGGVAGLVNGNMFGGLFGRSAVVRLGDADRAEALQLDGAELFDPMGNGRLMQDTVMLPEEVFQDPEQLRAWLRRGFDHTSGLPKKVKKAPAAKKPVEKKKTATKNPAKPKKKQAHR